MSIHTCNTVTCVTVHVYTLHINWYISYYTLLEDQIFIVLGSPKLVVYICFHRAKNKLGIHEEKLFLYILY